MKNETNFKRLNRIFNYFIIVICIYVSCLFRTVSMADELHIVHKDFLDPDIPVEVQQSAEVIGSMYNICPELLESIAWHESKYKAKVKSEDGSCWGIMQVSPRWHKARMQRLGVSKNEMLECYPNMLVAADYLHELFEQYEDIQVVLKKYNGDTSKGSSKYIDDVLKMSAELEEKHGK